MIPATRPNSPSADRAAPTGSRVVFPPRDVGTIRAVAADAITASVTLIANTDDHENHSSSVPERSSPTTAPAPAMPAQMPTARPRSSSGKTFVMMERVVGMTSAAPTPITARSAISQPGSLTKTAASDATPKTARPIWRMPLRPKRSPSAPAGSRRPAKTSAYASTIHCSWLCDAPVLRARSGSATFSEATAATTIISARHITASTARRARAERGCWGPSFMATSKPVPTDVKDEPPLGTYRTGMTTWRATPGRVPELRRLRYFLAVAGEQNFTRAAELLHVAQPALSRQVRLLERELGVELLHRTTHTFALTEAGRYLFERGPVLLDAADELWRLTSAFGAGERGAVAFGYGASAGYETVPELMRALTVRLPDVEITTHVMSTGQILAGVDDGTIDLGAVRCPPADTGLETRLLRLEAQGIQLRGDDPRSEEHTSELQSHVNLVCRLLL